MVNRPADRVFKIGDYYYLKLAGRRGRFLCKVINGMSERTIHVEVTWADRDTIIGTDGFHDPGDSFFPENSNIFLAWPSELCRPSEVELLMILTDTDE